MSIAVPGFKASGIVSGIKQNGRKDLGLLFSEFPATVVGVFTSNTIQAAPVIVTRAKVSQRNCYALIVNSGNANACTGEQGIRDAHELCGLVAGELNLPEASVLVSSTGIIGVPLPMDTIRKSIPSLVASLSAHGIMDFAEAIMTTDTFPKIIEKRDTIAGKQVTICGIAKGAGMIMPRMATLLTFVLTDAALEPGLMEKLFKEAVNNSFNAITIDGDTSTNDMVLMMANGAAENPSLTHDMLSLTKFTDLLNALFSQLARLILKDAEGGRKIVSIRVEQAANDREAKRIAYKIANSPLVKTALYGEDPNWGRIMAAIGNAEADIYPQRIDIYFDEVMVVERSVDRGMKSQAKEVMKKPEYTITVTLHHGIGRAEVATTDLTAEYVKINASYPT